MKNKGVISIFFLIIIVALIGLFVILFSTQNQVGNQVNKYYTHVELVSENNNNELMQKLTFYPLQMLSDLNES